MEEGRGRRPEGAAGQRGFGRGEEGEKGADKERRLKGGKSKKLHPRDLDGRDKQPEGR